MICISWAIFYAHNLIGYENTRDGTSCRRQEDFYSTLSIIYKVTIDAILLSIVMIVFNLLMLKRVYALRLRRERNVLVAGHVGPTRGSSINIILTNRSNSL